MSSSRRSFLRGRFNGETLPQRPPWALAEDAFESACTRCGECATVCPTAIIVARAGGFPEVDFTRGECTFCGDCVAACAPQALHRTGNAPWPMRAVIGDGCLAQRSVECRVCGEACAYGAIVFRPTLGGIAPPAFDAARCTGCGACVAPCPVAAIAVRTMMETESQACR